MWGYRSLPAVLKWLRAMEEGYTTASSIMLNNPLTSIGNNSTQAEFSSGIPPISPRQLARNMSWPAYKHTVLHCVLGMTCTLDFFTYSLRLREAGSLVFWCYSHCFNVCDLSTGDFMYLNATSKKVHQTCQFDY